MLTGLLVVYTSSMRTYPTKLFGLIYKVVSPSGKVYIGQTSTSLNYRKTKHLSTARRKNNKSYNTVFMKAIRKYGDTLVWTILHANVPIKNLNQLEIDEIEKHESYTTGYNSTKGGDGFRGYLMSDAQKKRLSKMWSGKNSPKYGKPVSKETRERISKATSGKNHWTTRKSFSEETRAKMSAAHKGSKHHFYGKHHSDTTCKKLSDMNKGKKISPENIRKFSGENNGSAKLTKIKVVEIKTKYSTGSYTYRSLASEYGVVHSTIIRIVKSTGWSYV